MNQPDSAADFAEMDSAIQGSLFKNKRIPLNAEAYAEEFMQSCEKLSGAGYYITQDRMRSWFASAIVCGRMAQLNCQQSNLDFICEDIHKANVEAGWWSDLTTGERKERNVGELLMLCVSELAEGMEGHRKNLMDDKLPHRPMLEVELADCFIRIADMAKGLGLDLAGAVMEKRAFNASREDHRIENRKLSDGKKY